MTEAELVHYFDYFLQNYQIQTQIMRRESKLFLMLNRPPDVDLDYSFLTEAIIAQLRNLPLEGIETVMLNSRVLGESKPDWKTAVSLSLQVRTPLTSATTPHPPQQSPSSLHSLSPQRTDRSPSHPLEQEETASDRSNDPGTLESSNPPAQTDLSSYCFVRNQLLVKTSLPDPVPEVATAVQFFHQLTPDQQIEVAETLVLFFKNPEAYPLQSLPEERRVWLTQIQHLNEQKLKSVAVWLSRYCQDADRAMTQVNATLRILTPTHPSSSSSSASIPAPDPSISQMRSSPPQTPSDVSRVAQPKPGTADSSPKGATGYRQRPNPRAATQPISRRPAWQRFALPVVGVCLLIAIGLSGLWIGEASSSIHCHPPTESSGPTVDRFHLCLFASQLLGEDELRWASESAARLEEGELQNLPYLCSQDATESSDVSLFWGDPAGQTYRVAEVMPGIYAVDLEQQFQGGSRESLQYGCIFKGTAAGTLSLEDSDYLPENWPEEPYRPSSSRQMRESVNAFGGLSAFALLSMGGAFAILLLLILAVIELIVTAGSFYLISRMGLGIQIYSLPDLLLGSVVFTLWSGVLGFIPGFGFLFTFAVDMVALLLTAWLVKGFKVDYSVGYPMLLLCVFLLFAIQFTVWMVLFWAFGSMVLSMLS